MPDIFAEYNKTKEEKNPEQYDALKENNPIDISGDLSNDPEQQKRNEEKLFAQKYAGGLEVNNLELNPDSWSPEYSAKNFFDESLNSLARGAGKLISNTGSLIQGAGALISPKLVNGTWLSDMLQEAGGDIEEKFKTYIPEELQQENITWSTMANPKFWSIQIAEMVPDLIYQIGTAYAGGYGLKKIAEKGIKAGVKKGVIKGVAKTALKKEIYGTGKGLIGKLATDQGLTQLGATVVGSIGGGITSNLYAGILNAADAINENKDLKDPNSNPLYSEDELREMAASTVRNNASWLLADIASWGMTYGGGWKAIKGMTGKYINGAKQSKLFSTIFKKDISPMVKAFGKATGKGILEGVEETFQETFEEWSKIKAVSEVTGKPLKYKNFLEYYNSDENKATKVISFALGALGGTTFNIAESINGKAEEVYKLQNRIKNFTEINKKNGTEEELSWQQYHIRQQIADIVIDENTAIDDYNDFTNSLVENENITKEEKDKLDELYNSFIELKEKGKKLNVKGLSALMHNKAIDLYVDEKINEYKSIAKEAIETINSLTKIDEKEKQNKIKKEEEKFESRLKALSLIKSEAQQNIENLMIGKEANIIDLDIVLDEFGNEMVVGGLSEKQSKEYLLEEGETLQENIDKIETATGLLKKINSKFEKASKKTKEIANSIKNLFSLKKENDNTEENISKIENVEEEANNIINNSIENPEINSEEVIPDDVYQNFIEKSILPKEVLPSIALKINDKKPLSEREEEIRDLNKDLIRKEIVKIILETNKQNEDTKLEEENNKQNQDQAEREAEKAEAENSRNNINNNKQNQENNEQEKNQNVTEEIDKDENLTKEEKEFIKEQAKEENEKGKTLKDVNQLKKEKAKKKFKIKKDEIEDAGLDKRTSKKQESISKQNLKDFLFKKTFLSKLKKSKLTETNEISKREMDNYLNRYTTYNLYGPSNLDKMIVVNHFLQQAFPNTKEPTQAFIVRNLFEAIGSKGLGHSLAMTIYIDEKSWNQDKVYMHELSHIYYKLTSKDEPTQSLLKEALKDKKRLKDITKKYRDYILFSIDIDGSIYEKTLSQLHSALSEFGMSEEQIDNYIKSGIEDESIKKLPLQKQKYILEELFVSYLEEPLSERFDKLFYPKEMKRQIKSRKWWTSIKKRGEVIQKESNIDKLLKKLNDNNDIGDGTMKDYLLKTFSAVTEGVKMDSFGLDSREEIDEELEKAYEDINKKKINSLSLKEEAIKEERFIDDSLDEFENSLENVGEMNFDSSFDSKLKKTTKILRKFGNAYNKVLRIRFEKKTQDGFINRKKEQKLFNRDLFESFLHNLAKENIRSDVFIYQIENSEITEVKAFNKFLNKAYPNTKYQILNSMHYVLSNQKHIVGFRNIINSKGEYSMIDSLSNSEISISDRVLSNMKKSRELWSKNENDGDWKEFNEAVYNILNRKETEDDYFTVLNMITDPFTFSMDKILEEGKVTYKGNNIPIETLISGFIRNGYIFNQNNPKKGIYLYNLRPIIESLINTNRKFTPKSSVKNAEGHLEPVRIVNNHMTKEIDNMIDFLYTDPTKEKFLERYSHITAKEKKNLGKKYQPNIFLENIYDRFQQGILPTISMYHGIEDSTNNIGNLYKNSSSLEQFLEDFLIFKNTSTSKTGKRLNYYLQNMGAFADSPRKFFINNKRVSFDDVFDFKNKKLSFKKDGKIINSIFHIHNNSFNDEYTNNKRKFREQIIKDIRETISIVENNAKDIRKINVLKGMFDPKNKLNLEGQKIVAEFVLNNIIAGYNINEVFLPGIKKKSISKRFKLNSSQVMSVNNKNFKIEPLFFADEIINNSISGTDSGMYILKEDADKFIALGKGVFDMNYGFKFLNGSIEKENPNFIGKTAYFKGYTTIIDETHPLYPSMKERKEKYNQWHIEKYGKEPSIDLTDQTPNHVVIAMPVSSDKSNFFTKELITERKNENGETVLEYTEEGSLLSPIALQDNRELLHKIQDELFYDKKGNFIGIETYNFGPQQLMDKKTKFANVATQMVNAVMTNASITGKMDLALKIQEHISLQKRKNLQNILDKIKNNDIESYKKLIIKGLNKEDMDQAQRILLEDNGSLFHPAINEIIVNQLAKTIRRSGNKLKVNGTYAHQKPDLGQAIPDLKKVKINQRLNGYSENTDGTLNPAEIILPKHFFGEVTPREEITIYTHKQELKNLQTLQTKYQKEKKKKRKKETTLDEDLEMLKSLAIKKAKIKTKKDIGTIKGWEKNFGETKDENGILIGYHVKGDTTIVTRVPSHGPSSTGIFEVLGFDYSSDGNQVIVPSEFNDFTGADNDGDALFVHMKGNNKNYKNWNIAFEGIKELWLSKEMKDQIRTKIEFIKKIEKIVDSLNKKYPKTKKSTIPFSPVDRMNDYENTMVAKRNVGPIFNIHKVANLLAAYEIRTDKNISINNIDFDKFKDIEIGQNSRNQNSAILANLILDNNKYGFADSLGINENTISEAAILINLGLSFEEVGMILNSAPIKMWVELNRKNKSIFHEYKSKEQLFKKIRISLKLKKNNKRESFSINTKSAIKEDQYTEILDLFEYLTEMKKEIQAVSNIMSGHSKIHVNPLVLETQIENYNDLYLEGNTTLKLTEDFKNNPDLKNYKEVAEETLKHLRKLNPIYRKSTNDIVKSLKEKIGKRFNEKDINYITSKIKIFNASRLLGLNNIDSEYAKNLIDPNSKESIYEKLKTYLRPLYLHQKENNNTLEIITAVENSVLFGKALSFNLIGNVKYLSTNMSFINEGFNKYERKLAQKEFEELPTDLQDDLILYDLIKHGWSGKKTLSYFFGEDTNMVINMTSNDDFYNKNNEISKKVLNQLETILISEIASKRNNSLHKIDLGSTYSDKINNDDLLKKKISTNDKILKEILKGKSLYVKFYNTRGQHALYRVDKLTPEQIAETKMLKSLREKRSLVIDFISNNSARIDNNLTRINNKIETNLDVATIKDQTTGDPFKTYATLNTNPNLDPLVEATIKWEEIKKKLKEENEKGLDAREDFYIEEFTKEKPLSFNQWNNAMEFKSYIPTSTRENGYRRYLIEKKEANKIAKKYNIEEKTDKQLLEDYEEFGKNDVYAYSVLITPIIRKLANKAAQEQTKLTKRKENGKDITPLQAYFISGSTIPSNHPASQAMARMLEVEYKRFINEKKKYISEMNKITNKLYKEKLGYDGEKRILNTIKRIRDSFLLGKKNIYEKLYGNLVIREEVIEKNKLTYVYKLKKKEDVEEDFKNGKISKAEKDFYDFFKKTTDELKPKKINKTEEDYIPHTSMTRFESFSNRGIFGLLLNSKPEEEQAYNVRLYFKNPLTNKKELLSFKEIEDVFKIQSIRSKNKYDLKKAVEYKKLKRKAIKLVKQGKNEDGSNIIYSPVETETALGFGVINRFAHNRSIKAKEMPSMDLNKALGDYIHSTLFVDGNDNFKGFLKLQPIIDGVLAYNNDKGYYNMNKHVQKVWKDYFLRGIRQTSFLGKKADKIILGLTKMNLFYALGYQGIKNTGGTYAIGNILAGKYHNIKDIGGKQWIKGELRYWGLDKGFKIGIDEILKRRRRMASIMKEINFMEINVYDEVNMEKKNGLDNIFSDLALSPMIYSEKWIQQVHMLGYLTDEEFDKFDENGKYKDNVFKISEERIVELEDKVKSSHGRGYQPTDQRAVQLYSWGTMMLQFSRFIPTMVYDRFSKKDINIYGKENIGTLRAVGDMIRNVVNDPKSFIDYRKNLSSEERKRLDSGLKGMAMSALILLWAETTGSKTASDLYGDVNYYFNYNKLSGKITPSTINTTNNFISKLF